MPEVTLIGNRLATEGEEFVFHGEASACAGCPYRDQCLNLVEGRKYRVVEVRENAPLLECGVHDEGVVAVEVEAAPVTANVPNERAYAGNKTSLAGPCPHVRCPSHPYCVPTGLDFDEERRVRTVRGDPPHEYCALDRELSLVEFAPAGD